MKSKNNSAKIAYSEPEDFFPKELRKKYQLGEYAEEKAEKMDERTKIRLELDPELLPKTVELFALHKDEELPAYDLATALVGCDRTANMPRCLFDFIVGLYEKAIAEGNDDAMNDLGTLYYNGRGCNQDFTKALYYYEMAFRHGNRQAAENLGYCYYYGRSIPADYEKAFHYFALGAFEGNLISLYKIGDLYQNGYYVQKNLSEAFHIYEHCMNSITDESAPLVAGPVFFRLGNAFLEGLGTDVNVTRALICFQKAEMFLYDMVAGGDTMYKKSWCAAIEGQERARELLASALPKQEWRDEPI